MKRVLSAFCCIALCSLPLLAQRRASAKSAMTDQQFLDVAAQTDMVEINLAQLAQANASAQSVKDYAQMLITDHTNDFNHLYDVAHQANLTRPDAIDAAHNKSMIGPYQKLKGEAFDRRYIHDMIAGHTAAIATYKKEAAAAENPDVKSYAEETIPTLQKHLDGAKALLKAKTK